MFSQMKTSSAWSPSGLQVSYVGHAVKVDILFLISHFLDFKASRLSLSIIDYAEVNVFTPEITRRIKCFRIRCK